VLTARGEKCGRGSSEATREANCSARSSGGSREKILPSQGLWGRAVVSSCAARFNTHKFYVLPT
jgi:hypothetical protein